MKNSGENIIVSHNCQSSSCNRWTVTGKVSDVIRTAGSQKPDLHFDYDAMGQRIAKKVTNKNVTTGDKFVTTYYVRDPQGNVMAVYEHKRGESDNGTFTLTEQHLYGASRLGMKKRDLALNVANASESTPAATHYELTNHLGNVLAVISDEASTTDKPTIVSLSDYYPFGMTEPGRNWNSGDYRFGYTGHEKENDLAEGVYTTEYRLLDTRLGRWMSVDPLFAKYPDMGAYGYCAGNPVVMVDINGDKLYFAEGCSTEFKKAFREAVNYLKKNGCDYALARLESSDESFYIKELEVTDEDDIQEKLGKTSYNTETHIILWNPKYGAVFDNGNAASPATILNHEAAHAARHARYLKRAKEVFSKVYNDKYNYYRYGHLEEADALKKEGEKTKDAMKRLAKEAAQAAYQEVLNEYHKIRKKDETNPYEYEEEKQNIMFDEQETVHKTGEVPADQVTRTSHGELEFRQVESVTSKPIVNP